MALFDRYLIVDWSASNTPKTGSDSIWVCLFDHSSGMLAFENIATRSMAMETITGWIEDAIKEGKRLFAGFDFAFGYPQGTAETIGSEGGWQAVWSKLSTLISDTDANGSNRFEAAGQLNKLFEKRFAELPFWGHPHQHEGRYPGLGPKKPNYVSVSEKRLVEQKVKSAKTVWQLCYTGAVGSQSLLGIPRLENLRQKFGKKLQIWPFETGFAEKLDASVVVAEIYPSLLPVEVAEGEAKDAAQVRTMAQTFAMLDQDGRFENLLDAPNYLTLQQRQAVLSEESWIVGVGHEIDLPSQQTTMDEDYIRDPAEIYRRSFSIVEEEGQIESLPKGMRKVATRLIHSCGMVDVVDDLQFSTGAGEIGTEALRNGCPVFCDVEMVRSGIIERLLPADNELVCTLNEKPVPDYAKEIGNTRSAAAVDLWGGALEGAVVAIGNAPTALFRLLENIKQGGPRPALIVGIPVGFVGAIESKQALAANSFDIPFITVHGRRGGSAMASSVVNALAGGLG